MDLPQIDAEIGRLRRAADAVSTNLLELERDPNRELIDAAGLQGTSADQWAAAMDELAAIWQQQRRFAAFLDELGKRRGTRARLAPDQESELAAFVTGPSIELTRDDVPLAERPLLGSATATTHCTADDLLARMSTSFDEIKATVLAIAHRWDTMVTRVRDLRTRLTALQQSGAPSGDRATVGALDGLQSRVDILSELLVLDPLAVAPEDLEAIEQDVASLDADLAGARALRAGLDDRMAKAHALLDEVRGAVDAATEAHREVTAKITAPDVPAPPPATALPVEDLDRIESLAVEGRWREADGALVAWNAAADDLLRDAFACAAANRAPIEVRNQLRARLDGYRAMARRLGVLEDIGLSARYEEARDVLFTAPTDLSVADDLVRAYRDALPRDPVDRKAAR